MNHTDSRGVQYAITEHEEGRKHGGKPGGRSFTHRRISDRPVDVKRAGRKGMSNAAKRAARKEAK